MIAVAQDENLNLNEEPGDLVRDEIRALRSAFHNRSVRKRLDFMGESASPANLLSTVIISKDMELDAAVAAVLNKCNYADPSDSLIASWRKRRETKT